MKRFTVLLLLAALFARADARADDRADCIAAFEAGQKLRAEGKLTGAIPAFSVCAKEVCPRSLQRQCFGEAEECSALLPTVVLSASDASKHNVVDVRVTVDGTVVATVLDGKAIPIDPGLHAFRFEKEGTAAVERQVAVKEGQKGQLVAVELAAPEEKAPTSAAVLAERRVESQSSKAEHARVATIRWVGIGVGVAGLVGIGLGSAYGAMAFSKWRDARAQCGASCAPGSAAYVTESTGKSDATVSNVAFLVGGVLAAEGVVLFVIAPSHGSAASAALVPTLGGAGLVGTF